jgi:hypothetical protein
MKRTTHFAIAIAFLMVAATATSASAGWREFWHNLHVDYARNNAWPDPFNEVDANMVMAPFDVMKANGWRMHNTIGHELFRTGDGALLAAGHKRIHWIATQAPTARRSVYVMRGASDEETQARVAAVRNTLANVNVIGPAPAVLVTDIEPATSSGAWATKINREWLEHLTAPQLPSQSVTGNQGVAEQTD